MFRSHSKIWYVDLRTNSDFRSRSFDLFPPTQPQIWYNRLRKHQASVSASLGLGPTRWHMQNMQTSEFLHLGPFFGFCWQLGRLPREMAQHGDFGDTSVTVCSLSGRVGCLHYFPSSFSISSTCQVGHLDLEILLSHISSNFCDVFCWTLHCYGEGERAYTAYAPYYDISGSWHIYSLNWNGVGLILWSLGLKFLSQMTRRIN